MACFFLPAFAVLLLLNSEVAEGSPLGNRSRRLLALVRTGGAGSGSAAFVEGLQVEVLQEACQVRNSSYFNPLTLGATELASPGFNTRDTADACCTSCKEEPDCAAWNWCPQQGGCSAAAVDVFPFHGCQLLSLGGASGTAAAGKAIADPGLPFVTGVPRNISLPRMSGYQVLVGSALKKGEYDYSCASSVLRRSCALLGNADAVSLACDEDPACLAFNFYPAGLPAALLPAGGAPGVVGEPAGVLKGGLGKTFVNVSMVVEDPAAALYVFKSAGLFEDGEGAVVITSGEESGAGGGTALIVGATVGGVVALVLVALVPALIAWRRYSRRLRRVRQALVESPAGGSGRGTQQLSGLLSIDSTAAGADAEGSGQGMGTSVSPFMLLDAAAVAAMMSGATPSGAAAPTGAAASFEAPAPLPRPVAGGQLAIGTARELLDTFARVYNEHTDYANLATMIEAAEGAPGAALQSPTVASESGGSIAPAPAASSSVGSEPADGGTAGSGKALASGGGAVAAGRETADERAASASAAELGPSSAAAAVEAAARWDDWSIRVRAGGCAPCPACATAARHMHQPEPRARG